LRDEFLEREEFEDEVQAQALSDLWKEDYNNRTPAQFVELRDAGRFQRRVAGQDLDHESVEDRDGVEGAIAPGVAGLPARGSDRIGFEAKGDVLL